LILGRKNLGFIGGNFLNAEIRKIYCSFKFINLYCLKISVGGFYVLNTIFEGISFLGKLS